MQAKVLETIMTVLGVLLFIIAFVSLWSLF